MALDDRTNGGSRPKREFLTMATMTKPKKEGADETLPPISGQKRPQLERFHLKVDGQTKRSHATLEAAVKEGKAIKTAHPVVKVSVYDSEEHERTNID
jgi:hypothetical protein